jgi:hypothetical protein
VQGHKRKELEHTRSLDHPFDEFLRHTQVFWRRADGFVVGEKEREQEDIDAWIEQLDSPESIERWRRRKELGLAEIQTKAFESLLEIYFVGDEVPAFVVSKILGHSKTSTTLEVYGHLIPVMHQEVGNLMDKLLTPIEVIMGETVDPNIAGQNPHQN